MRYLDQLKKGFVLIVAALSIAIVNTSPAIAWTATENYLQQIAQYTNSILQFLQNPSNFAGVGVSLMQQDTGDSTITTVAQQSFAASGWKYAMSQQLSLALQKTALADIIGIDAAEFSGKNPPVLKRIPNVNDLAYSTLLGTPPAEDGPANIYNYIKNAAGVDYQLLSPSKSWEGDKDAIKKYRAYYNTIVSIKAYDTYILSQLAFDAALKVNETQNELIKMASSSSWIAQVATQELGRVFRQILLFESQNFVLNTQIEKSLRQMVSLQTMSNTLLINLNAVNEKQLADAAKGKDSGGATADF